MTADEALLHGLPKLIMRELCELSYMRELYNKLSQNISMPLTVEHIAPTVFHSGILFGLSYRPVAGAPDLQYEMSGLDQIRGSITRSTDVKLANGEVIRAFVNLSTDSRAALERKVRTEAKIEALTVGSATSYDDLEALARLCGVSLEPTMARYSKKGTSRPIARVIRTKISIAHGHTIFVISCERGVRGFYVAQNEAEESSVRNAFEQSKS